MMKNQKLNKILKIFLPSCFDIVITTIIIFLVFLRGSQEIFKDGDTGYHTRTGQYILENLAFPTFDFYSFTCYGKEWIPFSWGTDVLFAFFNSLMGLNGILLLCTLLIIGTLYCSYKLMMHWKINYIVILASLLIIANLTTVHWLARPHLFTLFFTTLTFYLLEKAKTQKLFYVPIPMIMLIWANIHPGFIAGFFLLTLYLLGNFCDYLFTKSAEKLLTIKYLFITAFISFIFSFINPYSIKLYLYIYKTLTSSWIVNATQEYHSPNFTDSFSFMLYGLVITFLIVTSMLSDRRILDTSIIFNILFWTHLSLFAARNIPLFAIIAVPSLALIINSLIDQFNLRAIKDKSTEILENELQLKYHLWPITILVFSFIIALNNGYLFHKQLIKAKFPEGTLPVKAMEYYINNPIKGNLLNEDNWGGYIIYKYPEIKVFMDGRLDMYQQEFLEEYQNFNKITDKTDIILDKYNIQWVLFSRNTLMFNYLSTHPDWKLYYEDMISGIFIRG